MMIRGLIENRIRLVAAGLLMTVGGLVGCSSETPETGADAVFSEDRPLKILATTGPVGDILQHLAAEGATVDVLMGPGVDPHLYKERPSDIKKLDGADIVFYNGLHLEGSLAEVLERQGKTRPVFAVTGKLLADKDERLRYPEEFEGFADPHVWHDAALWTECATEVESRLVKFDPANADHYRAAGEKYRSELMQLHDECRGQIESLPENRRVLVTAHDAFGYFSRAYGLEPVGLKGVSTEDEVSLGRMDEVAQLIVDRKLPAVFVESSVQPRVVEAVIEPCQQAGHDVAIGGELYADSLGPEGSGAETYEGMMRANVATIVAALKDD